MNKKIKYKGFVRTQDLIAWPYVMSAARPGLEITGTFLR